MVNGSAAKVGHEQDNREAATDRLNPDGMDDGAFRRYSSSHKMLQHMDVSFQEPVLRGV